MSKPLFLLSIVLLTTIDVSSWAESHSSSRNSGTERYSATETFPKDLVRDADIAGVTPSQLIAIRGILQRYFGLNYPDNSIGKNQMQYVKRQIHTVIGTKIRFGPVPFEFKVKDKKAALELKAMLGDALAMWCILVLHNGNTRDKDLAYKLVAIMAFNGSKFESRTLKRDSIKHRKMTIPTYNGGITVKFAGRAIESLRKN